MTVAELAFLLLALAVLQGLLWLAARGLGSRVPARLVAGGFVVPLVFLSPWIAGHRLLVPSEELSLAVPGAPVLPRPPSHGILNDVIYQLLPWELEVRHALSEGRLPLWSHALEGGSSPWSNPQAGVLSPVAALARPLPIQHHLLAALALKMMVAMEGTWLLLRRLGTGRAAAWVGGLGVALGGTIQPWALFPPSTTAAWIPWLVLAGVRLLRRPCGFAVTAGACLGATLLVSGNPEVAALGGVFSVLWALLLARRPPSWRGLAAGAGAGLLALGLAAPLWLPFLLRVPSAQRLEEVSYDRLPVETLDWRPASWFLPRRVELLRAPLGSQAFGRPYRDVYRGSLNWAEAGAGYAGLAALVGTALAMGAGWRRAWPFALAAAFALLLAAGFVPLRLLVEALPGAELLAFPRLLLISSLALAVTGALGVDRLLRGRTHGWAVALTGLIAAVSLAVDARPATWLLWAGILAAVVIGRRRPRPAGWLLGVVLVLDLGPWAWQLQPRSDPASFYPKTRAIELLRRETGSEGGRVTGEDLAMYPSLLVVYGFDEVRHHNPLAPRDYAGVLRTAFGFSPSRRYFSPFSRLDHPLLDFLGVEAVVSYSTRPGAPGFRPPPRTLERFDAGELGTFRLLRNPDPLARVFVPTSVERLRRDQLEEWIRRLEDPRRVAVSREEAGAWRPRPQRWSPDAVQVLEWRSARTRLAVKGGEGLLLATSLPGPRGWRARTQGGRELETLSVNGGFLGVVVPSGSQEVELVYRPPGLLVASLLAGVTLGALVGCLTVALYRRRRRWRPALPRLRPAWVGAGVAIWLALSLLVELRDQLEVYLARGPGGFTYRGASGWRLESPPVRELERFLDQAARHVPEGSTVAFVSRALGEGQSSYRIMWASYLMPRHDVLPQDRGSEARYWIAYKTRLQRAGLETLWESDDGAVYRVVSP